MNKEKLEIKVEGKLKSLFEQLLSEEGKKKLDIYSIELPIKLWKGKDKLTDERMPKVVASTYKIICEYKNE